MKIKGLNKIIADSKLLNGNSYLQICFDTSNNKAWAIWHTGFYVNFQAKYDDKNIITIANIFEKVDRKKLTTIINNQLDCIKFGF